MKFEKEKFLHSEYLNNIAQVNRFCVVEGCEVTPAGGMQLNISAGTILFNGESVEVPAQTVTLDAADAVLNRADLIVVDNSGNVSVLKGNYSTADDVSTPLSTVDYDPTQYVVLARVNVWAGATQITADYVKDLRVFGVSSMGMDLGVLQQTISTTATSVLSFISPLGKKIQEGMGTELQYEK